MDEETPRYTSLQDYARLIRKQWALIVVPVVLAVVAALAYSLHETPTYDARAQVMIQDETQQLSLLGSSAVPGSTPSSGPAIVAQTISTPALAAAVKRTLRTPVPASALMGDVSLSVDATTGLLDVDATSGTADFAAALANAYASRIAGATSSAVRRQFATAAHVLQRRLNQLSPSAPGDATERAILLDEISRLEFLQVTSKPGQVVKTAIASASAVSPKPVRNVGLGLLAGLLIGVMAAFMREAFDRRMRGSSEIAGRLGLRLLGRLRGKALGRVVDPGMAGNKDVAGDVEMFRILRNNIEELVGDQPARAVLVTSALPEEGKSTVAASLALASAAAGRRTLLLEADLRRPSLARRLGVPSSPGLIDYLTGNAEPETVLRSIPVSSDHGVVVPIGAAARAENLVCLPAGRSSGGSAELLASTRMRELLADVSEVYELVIVDTAPLLPVADTLALLPAANAVVLCVRSGRTTEDQIRAARSALARVPAEVTGVVVTDVRGRDEAGGHGLYPYDYSYAEREQAKA